MVGRSINNQITAAVNHIACILNSPTLMNERQGWNVHKLLPLYSVLYAMAWLERTLRGLSSLPTEVTSSLAQIREKGVQNRECANCIQDDEMALLEELQEAIRTGRDVDESLMKAKADALVQRRKDLSAHMDMQTKAVSSIYEKCGKQVIVLYSSYISVFFYILSTVHLTSKYQCSTIPACRSLHQCTGYQR